MTAEIFKVTKLDFYNLKNFKVFIRKDLRNGIEYITVGDTIRFFGYSRDILCVSYNKFYSQG